MKRFFKILLALIIGLILFSIWFYITGIRHWNQKLTVSVETPNGMITGHSVSSAYGGPSNFFNTGLGYGVESGASGEAVVVELPNNRYLFALVSGGPFNAGLNVIAHNVFYDQLPKETRAHYKTLSKLRASRIIPQDMYPLLVTFDDVTDPKTVRLVDPTDLTASFGAGYALKEMTLEITDEAVTRGRVEAALEWVRDQRGRIKPTNKRYADELLPEENLYKINFIKE